ncbi:hypothetical protein HDU91_001310, partial [Kappamyces sp. JEL0680]
MFEEGYRIAKANGGVNGGKQVAYLWARSLGGESAVKLLSKLGLTDSAIDFAAENGAFDFAFELARFSDKSKLADVHYKHAMFLEDEGRFKEAENAFILGGKPREAILMYIHEENWEAALAVAEAHEPASVPDVLVGQAKVAFTKSEFSKAESLLLRAQKPELAIKMYREVNDWKEAIRFTKQYLPSKLGEVNQAYDQYLSGQSDAGKDNLIATAQSFEQQREYARAIDIYLKLSPAHSDSLDFLEDKWRRAAELSAKFLPEKNKDVVAQVCEKLTEIKRFSQAGDLYAASDSYKNAIDTYIAGGLWEKAKKVLTFAPKYTDYVENAYVKHLKTAGHAEALVELDVDAGLEMYAQKGEWEKCLETAAAGKNVEVLGKYLASYTTLLVTQGKYQVAARAIAKYGSPAIPANFDLYQRIAQLVLKDPESTAEDFSNLREMVYKLVHGTGTAPQPKLVEMFGSILQIAHTLHLRGHCSTKKELLFFAAKQAISALRYTTTIPADRAFLEAGQAAKNAGMLSMAFVCWNRFLDLTEAIEEKDSSLLMENLDFQNTDVPFEVNLPTRNVEQQKIEQVRDWVLQVSLDTKVQQEIDKRECDNCGASTYDASLPANKEDWNKYVMAEKA